MWRRLWWCGMALALAGCLGGGAEPSVTATPAPVIVPPPKPDPTVLGLALGGGAARGFAHIGVLKVLDSHGIKPQVIVGTSAGSVAGALYAAGTSGFDLQQRAFDLDRATVADWSIFGKGLIRGDALRAYVNKAVGNRSLEALPIRFGCVSAKLKTGEAVLFERGETGLAVQASSAVPGVFRPAVINGEEFVDGGVVSVVPVKYAKRMGANFVIAVDVASPPDPKANASGALDVVMGSITIMGKTIREAEYPLADVVIVPDMQGITSADFEGKHKAILAGERAAQAALPKIRALLAKRGISVQ